MNNSMITAMSSMNGLQQRLDLLAENVANVNTAGYKRKQATFSDLLRTVQQQPEAFERPGRLTPGGFSQGWGARMHMLQPDLSQGALKETGLSTDVAIEGNALFEVVTDAEGTRAFTRNGAFQLTLNGNGDTILATGDGYPVVAVMTGADGQTVEGNVVLPPNYDLRIYPDGRLEAVNAEGTAVGLGRLKVVEPTKPALLAAVQDNLFAVPNGVNRDDVLTDIVPGEGNRISLHQGYLEQSNVSLVDELTELINVQRAYQLSARALSSSDMMMGMANSLRG
ncbi:flagellar basal body rod protein FlgG [Paenibacillus cisolokensis]|uniref:Flagellar basal body rod protein FlgG n=1 Tax=Paenibacillus cisolokensis TaxID=1658519 RepID=A0ABQ4N1F6_9BACL|nr:flagellar hook-basal body protein [Paenibacillus cisolokensis]GIQ61987.1 flagellar basal body rod protein FlgG [Paenibacillus cisolokensis]